MMNTAYLLNDVSRPEWLEYPEGLVELVHQGRVDLTPWHLMESDWVSKEMHRLRDGYKRELVPFAYHQGSDDVVCFERGQGDQVLLINAFCESGYETIMVFKDFHEWLKDVEDDMRFWGREVGR